MTAFTLISSPAGPWEQGIAVLLHAKGADFDVRYVDPSDKPDWFKEISPHGKMPVLKHGDETFFESSAIAEYLEDLLAVKHHPSDLGDRAQNRAWLDYLGAFQKATSSVNNAKSKPELEEAVAAFPAVAERLEEALSRSGRQGPYFNDDKLSVVDARYAPFFHRVDWCEPYLNLKLFGRFPMLAAWSETLLADPHVKASVREDFDEIYVRHVSKRNAYVSTLFPA